MAVRNCPACGQPVKLENMKRHFANVHPGKDASAAISEKEELAIKRSKKAARTRRRASPVWIAVAIVAVLVAGVVGTGYALNWWNPGGGTNFNIVTYCGGEGAVEHRHVLLVINVNGMHKNLTYDRSQSADIGYVNLPGYTNPSLYCGGGIHALHTHDGSGIIHVELPVHPSALPTLGNFFEIWGQPLTGSRVWIYQATSVHADVFTWWDSTSTDHSGDLADIPFYAPNGDPSANNYPIPPGLIFNRAYGTGQSGNYFSGEIIWLNVTTT